MMSGIGGPHGPVRHLLGAIATFLALAIAGLSSEDDEIVRSIYVAMDMIARTVIVPLVFASLATGLIQSLGTTWGLFRHFRVLAKLLAGHFHGDCPDAPDERDCPRRHPGA